MLLKMLRYRFQVFLDTAVCQIKFRINAHVKVFSYKMQPLRTKQN